MIKLRLSRLLRNMTISLNFLSKRIFVSKYFRVECCCKIFGAGLELESVKEFRSGCRVEKLVTLQHSNSKTFQAKATLHL